MSLIQEALRRQQEESGEMPAAAAPPPVQPVAPPPVPRREPPPMPVPATPPSPPPPTPPRAARTAPRPATERTADVAEPVAETGSGTRPWPTLVGIAALVLILVGGGAWMLLYAFQQWQGDGTSDDPTAKPEKPAAVVHKDPPAQPENITPDPDGNEAPPPTSSDDTAVTQTDTIRQMLNTPPPPPPEPVEWPLLQLTGVVGRGANGSVIINNEILGVGQSVEGAKVVAIGTQGAWLEYQGEKQFLSIQFVSQ